jgi:type IV pilus assembly protein PilM
MDPPLVAETIRAVIESLGVTPKQVVTAVGGRDIMIKKIQMDRMATEDAREVIRWEAEQYVPFDMSSVQLDFQVLDPDDDGLQMNVLLVAAKRELVDQRVMLLQDAGLSPAIVDVDAFALHNAFGHNYPDAGRGVVALVNVGHEISTILLQQDGVPVLNRDVPFGTRHVREELRRMHSLGAEEADAVLQGLSDKLPDCVPLLTERGEELAMAIERAVAFMTVDGFEGGGVGTIYLSGGGARMPKLVDVIANRLHSRVEIANPLQRLRVNSEASMQVPAEDLAPMLMLPIGLALRTAA